MFLVYVSKLSAAHRLACTEEGKYGERSRTEEEKSRNKRYNDEGLFTSCLYPFDAHEHHYGCEHYDKVICGERQNARTAGEERREEINEICAQVCPSASRGGNSFPLWCGKYKLAFYKLCRRFEKASRKISYDSRESYKIRRQNELDISECAVKLSVDIVRRNILIVLYHLFDGGAHSLYHDILQRVYLVREMRDDSGNGYIISRKSKAYDEYERKKHRIRNSHRKRDGYLCLLLFYHYGKEDAHGDDTKAYSQRIISADDIGAGYGYRKGNEVIICLCDQYLKRKRSTHYRRKESGYIIQLYAGGDSQQYCRYYLYYGKAPSGDTSVFFVVIVHYLTLLKIIIFYENEAPLPLSMNSVRRSVKCSAVL